MAMPVLSIIEGCLPGRSPTSGVVPLKPVACCVNGRSMKKKLLALAVLTVIFALVQFVDAQQPGKNYGRKA